MPSAEMDAIIDFLRSVRDEQGTSSTLVDVAAWRQRADALTTFFPVPDDVVAEAVDAGGVPADRVTVPGSRPDRFLLHLHGGAYVAYSARTHRELVARIARAAGVTALVPEYRLAPEHPYPAAVDDAVTAYRWLRANGPVVVAGDSAGGGLTLALVQRLRAAGDPLPEALALLSPWTDLTLSGPSVHSADDVLLDLDRIEQSAALYAADHDRAQPELSPVFADLTGFPPMYVAVGTAERLEDDSVRLVEQARAAGVEVDLEIGEGLPHVFQALATTPEAVASTDRIGAFVRHHVG